MSEFKERIEGRFVWYRGMLFFKADGGETMQGTPIGMPHGLTSTHLALATGSLHCGKSAADHVSGLPEDLLSGYELLIGIDVDSLLIPTGREFINNMVRTLSYPIAYQLSERFAEMGAKVIRTDPPGGGSE